MATETAAAVLEHQINLVMGDWSHDGHCMSETVTIRTNLSSDELIDAYEKGSKQVEFDLTGDVAADYEEYSFPDEFIEKLQPFGFKADEFLEQPYVDDSWAVSGNAFWRIWLFIAKIGDPSLEFEEVDNVDIIIGGYGMFSQ